jgi:hypothetical protein
MKEKNNDGIGNSLKEVITALFNVAGELIRKAPHIVAIFFGLLFLAIYSISTTKESVKLTMSILIGVFSIGIYLKNKNFSETILTLFLGLLTVFSIEWTKSNTLIFSGVLFSFIVVYFLISTVKLSSELESILTQTSTFLSIPYNKVYLKRLNLIVKKQTKYKQLGIIDKAKIARYLVFVQYPLESMTFAIEIIETIKIIYQIPLEAALDFFYSLNQVIIKTNNRNIELYDIDIIHMKLNKLPLTPNEFLEIFKETKMVLISGNLNIDDFFEKLTILIENGNSKKKIIEKLNE